MRTALERREGHSLAQLARRRPDAGPVMFGELLGVAGDAGSHVRVSLIQQPQEGV
jgi:hypothetical protein